MSTTEVPVIDISAFFKGDHDAVVAQVRDACEGVGFFTIIGHGVEQEIIESLRTNAREFFARPAAEKNNVHHADPSLPRGYRAIGDEGLAYGSGEETPPDLKEVFHMGPPDFPDDAYYSCDAAAGHFIENVYPQNPSEFRAAATTYYKRLAVLSQTIEEIFALALDLPPNFFREFTDRQIGALRIIRYPPTETAPPAGPMARRGAYRLRHLHRIAE